MENSLSHLSILMLLDNPFVSDARVEKEAATLTDLDAKLTIIGTKAKDKASLEQRNDYLIRRELSGIIFSPLKLGYNNYIKSIAKKLAEEQYDVVHCHDFHMLSIGVELKKIQPTIILIYDAHEYLIGWPYYQTSQKWLNKIKGLLVWKYLVKKESKEIRQVDFVLTVTNEIAHRLHINNSLNEVPTVLHNYPVNFQLKPKEKYFHQKFNFSEDDTLIIHSGTIYHTDEQLIDLFNLIMNISSLKLIFIGNRPRFFEVQEMVETSDKWAKFIFFHDYMSNQESNINLIASGDIGLLHVRDLWEAHKITFSNRFVEYIMANIPVIGTPQNFTKEVNDSFNCCAFYSENQSDQLKQAFHEMTTNIELYSKNAKTARESINWKSESKKLTDIYHFIAKGVKEGKIK